MARRIFTSQGWSVQRCVRPLSAVHMTAGHNALRGSGPGQNLAFENAVAHVGCPDRRIDRLCITCCSPSQPSHHAMVLGAISFTPQARSVPCSARPWPSSPRPSGRACWPARWRRLWSAVVPTTLRPKGDTWCHGAWHRWGNRPALLWIAENLWVLRFRLMVKRGPLMMRPQASEGEAQHGSFCWTGRIGQGHERLHCG